MKVSFYFVLWVLLAYLFEGSGIDFLVDNIMFFSLFIVLGVAWLTFKMLREPLHNAFIRNKLALYELAYTNNVSKLKKAFFNDLVFEGAGCICLTLVTIWMLTLIGRNTPWIEILICAFFSYMTGKRAWASFQRYKYVKTFDRVYLPNDEDIKEEYARFYRMRSSMSFEELCPKEGTKDRIFRWCNLLFAAICIGGGIYYLCRFVGILISGKGSLFAISYCLYSFFAIMVGINDMKSSVEKYNYSLN